MSVLEHILLLVCFSTVYERKSETIMITVLSVFTLMADYRVTQMYTQVEYTHFILIKLVCDVGCLLC